MKLNGTKEDDQTQETTIRDRNSTIRSINGSIKNKNNYQFRSRNNRLSNLS